MLLLSGFSPTDTPQILPCDLVINPWLSLELNQIFLHSETLLHLFLFLSTSPSIKSALPSLTCVSSNFFLWLLCLTKYPWIVCTIQMILFRLFEFIASYSVFFISGELSFGGGGGRAECALWFIGLSYCLGQFPFHVKVWAQGSVFPELQLPSNAPWKQQVLDSLPFMWRMDRVLGSWLQPQLFGNHLGS